MKLDNLTISSITRPVGNFVKRFHSIIFFSILGALLITASLVIITVINDSPAPATSGQISENFDQETIDKVEALDPTNIEKPSGRNNPFIE